MLVNIIRFAVIIVIMLAAVMVALGIFEVFSGEEIKDALKKTLALAGVIVVASGLVVLVSGKK